jgi:hypothetical protein
MAAPNMTPSRLGQVNASGDVDALFLKVFAGEVLTAFETKSVTLDRQLVRTITSGKSATFPTSWKASAAFHTPGNMIVGNAIKHNERAITIDGLLVADTFISSIDEAMNHYDVRSVYSGELGKALAVTLDQFTFRELQIGANVTTPTHGTGAGYAGTVLTEDADVAGKKIQTDADDLASYIMDGASTLDTHDVPDEDRYCILNPMLYWLLIKSDFAVNRDYSDGGSVRTGKIWEIAGVEIVKSNNIPTENLSSEAQHAVNMTKALGYIYHKSAVGTVKLMDVALEADYLITYQGTLMVGKVAAGHGYLRPEAIVALAAE